LGREGAGEIATDLERNPAPFGRLELERRDGATPCGADVLQRRAHPLAPRVGLSLVHAIKRQINLSCH
jgi:hypothetical protein